MYYVCECTKKLLEKTGDEEIFMKRKTRKIKAFLASFLMFALVLTMLPIYAKADDPVDYAIAYGTGSYQLDEQCTVNIVKIGDTEFSNFTERTAQGTAIELSNNFDPANMGAYLFSVDGGFETELLIGGDGKVHINAISPETIIPDAALRFEIRAKQGGGENNNNNDQNPNQNGNVRFNINNQGSAVAKYSLDGTNWYLVDADNEQNPGNINFRNANLTGITKLYVKVELGENMRFDDFVDNGHTRTCLLVEENGQPTDASQYGIEETLVSESGFSFNFDPTDNGKMYTVSLSFMQSNGEGGGEGGEGGHPQNNDNLSVVLLGDGENLQDIVLFENGNITNTVEGITISPDGDNVQIYMKNYKSGYALQITGGEPSFTVEGDNSLFGMYLGENVKIELWGKDHSVLSIGADGFHGENRSGIRFRDDLTVNVEAEVNAFDGVEEVSFNNYNFHERDKTNNIIFAHGKAFNGVSRVEIYSAKTEIAVEDELGHDGIECIVSEEGQLILHGNPGGIDFKTRYYEKYPGDGKAANRSDIDNCIKEVSIFPSEDLSAAAKASFDLKEGDSFVLTSLDPILYSISYQIDEGIRTAKDEDGNLIFGNPDAGSVFMNGFKRGYWVENGTGGRFEAWIAAGETVNVTILPNAGYQYIKNTLNINGATIDTEPGADKGTYSFVSGPNAGHICAGFIKTDDVVKIDEKAEVKDAGILGSDDGVIEAGNFELGVADKTLSSDETDKIKKAVAVEDPDLISLDLTLNEYVVKNYDPSASEQQAWETPLTDLNGKVTVAIELPDRVDASKKVQVVRVHGDETTVIDGKIEQMEIDGRVENILTFETDKFSTYAIAFKSQYAIIEGDDQTITIGDDGDVIIRCNGDINKFKGLKMDGKDVDPSLYTVSAGSTIVRLKREYVDSLPKGAHSLTFLYTDGEVTAHFTLQTKPSNDSSNNNNNNNSSNNTPTVVPVKDTVPKTGEGNSLLYIFVLLSIVSLFGMSVASYTTFKKRGE